MIPRSFFLLLLVLLASSSPAWCQLLGADSGPAGETPPPAETTVTSSDPATLFPGMVPLLERLKAKTPLSPVEFLVYIHALERLPANQALIARSKQETRDAKLPAQGWAMIAARLHNEFYSADRRIEIGPIDLFLTGTEDQNWKEISLLGVPPPKFLVLADGTRIDAAHAITGPAALVMRKGEIRGTLMSHVNTGWGDSLQVAGERIEGAEDWVVGLVTRNKEKRQKAGKRFQDAPGYKPPDQDYGNRIGNLARDYLQDDREDSLYMAMSYAWVEFEDWYQKHKD